ncbi:hypothetical protein AN2351V1_3352 [Citrobacter koseri]|nr:hypothetical protein AN2351V1_3352 [Citrobacter koseri]CAH6134991.1 hypothetical protein AN2351V1_3352 [Citrobacter koseri]SQB08924.1 Opacity protein and related surface antigens [Citrobacter koseri]
MNARRGLRFFCQPLIKAHHIFQHTFDQLFNRFPVLLVIAGNFKRLTGLFQRRIIHHPCTAVNPVCHAANLVTVSLFKSQFKFPDKFALYATAGAGVAKVKVGGWQGNDTREFAGNTQTNFTYSVGAGASYEVINDLTLYATYRYVDMGNIESGRNTFVNARALQDENMRGRLVNNEFVFGVRYVL